jgi:hypothetical protein
VSTFNANAVFHIDGLAARIINSHGLNQVSISSIPVYHEFTLLALKFSG